MIDRTAIEKLYNHSQYQDKVDEFYLLLVQYTQNQQTKKIEACLHDLNFLAKDNKSRPIYYDNHCIKTDLDRYIVEIDRLQRLKKKS